MVISNTSLTFFSLLRIVTSVIPQTSPMSLCVLLSPHWVHAMYRQTAHILVGEGPFVNPTTSQSSNSSYTLFSTSLLTPSASENLGTKSCGVSSGSFTFSSLHITLDVLSSSFSPILQVSLTSADVRTIPSNLSPTYIEEATRYSMLLPLSSPLFMLSL